LWGKGLHGWEAILGHKKTALGGFSKAALLMNFGDFVLF